MSFPDLANRNATRMSGDVFPPLGIAPLNGARVFTKPIADSP